MIVKSQVMNAVMALMLTSATAASAQDFSAGTKATPWNLYAETPALFEAQVVDLLCEITGDCAANCGDGRRQLALVRAADNVLVYPMKNNEPVFSGAVQELLPFCGMTVDVDGLMITDPDIGARNVYLVQRIRVVGSTDWVKADKWTKDWAAANPDADGPGPWFRRDPRVNAHIAKDGYFGLGLDRDQAIIKDLFE